MGREFTYLSSHATNRYFIPNWGIYYSITDTDNNDETVRFYTVDGKQLGAAKAINGTASQAVSESVVIAKMGNQTIKIAVK